MLKRVVTNLDSVDEKYHALYKQGEDGKFYLLVEGDDDAAGLKSALQKERASRKELEEKLKVYANIDLDKVQEVEDKLRQIEEKKLLDSGEVEKYVEKRTENMQASHRKQVSQLEERAKSAEEARDKYSSRLAEEIIQRQLLDAVTQVGNPRKEALQDIQERGRRAWRLDENQNPIAVDSDGTTIFGTDGKAPMTMNEWAQELLEKGPHLFQESKGGGAKGSTLHGNSSLTADQLQGMSPAQKRATFREQHL